MKEKKKNVLLIILIICIIIYTPIAIFTNMEVIAIFVTDLFITLFQNIFIIKPYCFRFVKENSSEISNNILITKIILSLFLSLTIPKNFLSLDFNLLVYGTLISFMILIFTKKNTESTSIPNLSSLLTNYNNLPEVICKNCNSVQDSKNNFCTNCGAKLESQLLKDTTKLVKPTDFDHIYSNSPEVLLEKFIEKELINAGFEKDKSLIPQVIAKKKIIFSSLLAILISVYICLIFFHFPIYTYIIGLIIIIIFIFKTQKYDFMTYLKKEIKSRPQEKISNIIMNIKNSLIEDKQKGLRTTILILGIITPLIVFSKPRIMYEKVSDGYAVRFYTFGLTNFKTVEIPEKHNGKPVLSLRGNTFSNMPFLEEVNLPNTIKEIRGQAFKNDINLKYVNIPSNLEYLGGGAFYNCKSITKIELPDSLKFLGGESFYNATSLEEIKLSENLTEIRGNSFENCSSLEAITIPDEVERIGGHAFYGNTSLKEVKFTENSRLKEIGSSAFRLCQSLRTITIPKNVNINERAFKESPTKIKYFGDIDFDNIVDKAKYKNNSFIYFQKLGESQTVNKYITDAIIKQTTLILVDAQKIDNYYQYTLKYIDESGETEFTISKKNLYEVINENLAVSIGSEYELISYNGGFSLNVYYN